MHIAAILFGFVALATGSILGNDTIATTLAPTSLKWGQRRTETCKLHNVQEGKPLSFISPLPMPVITVVFQRFTSINCAARNFCNITWFKNMLHPVEVGDFLELNNDSQVLEIQKAFYYREGNYTCVATDDTKSINRTVRLVVADTCTNQTASVGASAEFFCFFFAGDTIGEVNVTWYKRTELSAWVPVRALASEKTQYEETLDYSIYRNYSGSGLQPTAGNRLHIKHITPEAFVDYRLEATSSYGTEYTQPLSLSASPIPPKADLTAVITASVVLACFLILVVSLAVTWHFKKLDVRIWRKNRFGVLEDDDGKAYDAFISYADEDLPFALSIRESLEQAGYNVCVRDIDIMPATPLVEEIILALNTSRRCLIIISPAFIRAHHSTLQVDVAIDQMMHKQIKIVPIIYHDISSVGRKEMPLLKRILTNVKIVKWEENNAEKFTKQLLVHMPPLRPALLPPPGENDEWNLLRGSVASDTPIGGAMPIGRATPVNNENVAGCEMNRFLNDVAEADRRNLHMTGGQTEKAMSC